METLKNISKTVAIIFAGGQGKRLWPVSTQSLPKQLNPAFSKKILLKEAFDRTCALFPKERIIIVTTSLLADQAKKIISLPNQNWVVQPKNADTAMAMCLTALHIETFFPESTALLFYSDHKINNIMQFRKSIREIKEYAQKYPRIIAIGTKPTFANTQFGYIKVGKKYQDENLYQIDLFIEKPDEATASKYLKSKNYLWNTGVYAFQTNTLLNSLKKVAPKLYNDLLKLKLVIGSRAYQHAIKDWFENSKSQPFEKAVSEKLTDMLVYAGNYSWEDIGNWKAVYDISKKDCNKNVILEKQNNQNIYLNNTTGSLILSKQKNIIVAGVKDLIIVQTSDSLLICNFSEAEQLKSMATKLEDSNG